MWLSLFIQTTLGLIIFFIGMGMMSKSMSSLAGHKMKNWIAQFTSHPLLGITVGTLVTALTQSSSGTTVMVVSLVNSGVMNLYQATAVIMGANIGTTFTAQLISFNLFAMIPHIMFLGVLLYHLQLNHFSKYFGKFIFGFSLLFLGIKVMGYALDPLKSLMGFQQLMLSIQDQKLRGVFIGAATTAIIQSSSTGVAILQGLALRGLITIFQSMPIILGQNIGTCVTTIIAGIAADKNGKRAAIIHLFFNVTGAVLMYPFMDIFSKFIYFLTPSDAVKQIANAHSIFNILNTLILIPFITHMVWISKKIIR